MTRIGLRLMAVYPGFLLALGVVFGLAFASTARAQTAEINALKGKIFDANMARQTFAGGLPHCKELDGSNFYFRQRDRILNLEEYHHSPSREPSILRPGGHGTKRTPSPNGNK
jgi:hypothetical protein